MAKDNKKSPAGGIIASMLLIGAGAALFYFGWVQYDLPENTYAVLFSKTGGYDEKVISPGRFDWRWERILPTNSKLITMEIMKRSVTLDFQGGLPSADLYSSILPEKPDFSWHITATLSYRIKPETLPDLLNRNVIEGTTLNSFYSEAESKYLKIVKEGTTDFFNQNYIIDNTSYGELETILLEKLKSTYSFIEVSSFLVKYVNFPDLQLYGKSRDLYSRILDSRTASEIATEKWAIESKVNLDTKIEILTRYGELLSRYPILVDYFALDPQSQVLDISNLKDYSYSEKAGE